jgi:hypothetical protein
LLAIITTLTLFRENVMSPPLSPDLMRLILLLCLLGMELLAAMYLSQRRMPFLAYLGMGGWRFAAGCRTFYVILRRPGKRLHPYRVGVAAAVALSRLFHGN